MQMTEDCFGTMPSGEEVRRFTLAAGNVEVEVLAYGGIVRALRVPDRRGDLGDIVLGFDDFEPYKRNPAYFGALIGRYANRIANGSFTLDRRTYTLARNNKLNSLHGGVRGFDKRLWAAEQHESSLELSYQSADGEEGYPGNLHAKVAYEVTQNSLRITYSAVTDKPTVLNLTNHSYFNLAGSGTILQHALQIAADQFTPTDASQIPTGELRSVEGTPLDFRAGEVIGARISAPDEQLATGKGYDHNWVLSHAAGEFSEAAVLIDAASGRKLEVYTDQPGLQFYSGNLLDGSLVGKQGRPCERYAALCLETQHFPDSPNCSKFPSVVLRPGERFHSRTEFRFSSIPEPALR